MKVRHGELAAGRWGKMPLLDQMANVGSEVERAMSWRRKGMAERSRRAAERALELLDLTLAAAAEYPRLREVARVREAVVDDFFCENSMRSTDAGWRKYFAAFTCAARRRSGA